MRMDICVEINVNSIVRLILNKKKKESETKGKKEINRLKSIKISSRLKFQFFTLTIFRNIYVILINISCFKKEDLLN